MWKILKRYLVVAIIVMTPSIVYGGWFGDFFGVGGAATAIAEATWKVVLVKAVQTSLPLLSLIFMLGITITAMVYIARLVMEITATIREALKDGVVNRGEWVAIGIEIIFIVPIVVFLGFLAYYTGTFAASGLEQIMNFTSG